jgi:hypothetical protein
MSRLLNFAALLLALFVIGGGLGLAYQWYRGWTITTPFFVTAANNEAPSSQAAPVSNVLAPAASASNTAVPIPQLNPAVILNEPPIVLSSPTPQPNANALVLNQVRPPAPISAPKSELTLPEAQSQESADRLPALGSQGQTIWVPRAIEGCWEGTGDASLEYLGGCPNLFSGHTSPIKLRWCFRRVGNEPLNLIMARGAYGHRVAQQWYVTGAHGQSIELRETISYNTMMFLHVVDVGDWTCSITAGDELSCDEHELARCGPGNWMQPPWFTGSGWVRARRASGGNPGHLASGP